MLQRVTERRLHVAAKQQALDETNTLLRLKREKGQAVLIQGKLARQLAATKTAIQPLRKIEAPTLAHGLTLEAIEEELAMKKSVHLMALAQKRLELMKKDQANQVERVNTKRQIR